MSAPETSRQRATALPYSGAIRHLCSVSVAKPEWLFMRADVLAFVYRKSLADVLADISAERALAESVRGVFDV
jgi:hypothetical protein